MSPDSEFDAFVHARGPALIRAGYLLTGDQHLAEDLVQSALARTYRAWRRLDAVGNAEAYTRRVMYHLQVSRWRRRRVAEALHATVPATGDPMDATRDVDTRLAIAAALRGLPARQRAVLVLRFFEDQTEVATADVLGISVGTVKVHTRRGLARLREASPELADLPATSATEDTLR